MGDETTEVCWVSVVGASESGIAAPSDFHLHSGRQPNGLPSALPFAQCLPLFGFPEAEPESRIGCHDFLREGSRIWPQGKCALGLITGKALEHKLHHSVGPLLRHGDSHFS